MKSFKIETLSHEEKNQDGMNLTAMTRFLRSVGGGLVVAAAAVFLVQGVYSFSSFFRFLSFAGLVAALGGGGYYSSRHWKDQKGARVFMSLGIAGVSVLFAQLGALVYQWFSPVEARVPEVMLYQADNWHQLIAAGFVTIVISLPLMRVGFAVLSRSSYRWMSGAYLLSNLLLLIPLREPAVGLLLLAAQVLGVYLIESRFSGMRRQGTSEEHLARSMIYLPSLIMLCRSLFYDPSKATVGGLILTLSWVVLYKSQGSRLKPDHLRVVQFFSAFTMTIGWTFVAVATDEYFSVTGPHETLLYTLPAYLLHSVAYRLGWMRDSGYTVMAAWCAAIISLVAGMAHMDLLFSSLLITFGLFISYEAYVYRCRQQFQAGALLVLGGGLLSFWDAIVWIEGRQWLALAVFGLLALVGASFLESQGSKVRKKWNGLRQRWVD